MKIFKKTVASQINPTMSEQRDPATEGIFKDSDVDKVIGLGAIQPRGLAFPSTTVLVSGNVKYLRFQEHWFDGRPWLEYSTSKDEASCFYCRLFKPLINGAIIVYCTSVLRPTNFNCLLTV